jgi:hypothetical protein
MPRFGGVFFFDAAPGEQSHDVVAKKASAPKRARQVSIGKLHEPGASVPNVSSSLAWFRAGIVAGGVAHVTAYLTQLGGT